MVPRPHDLLRLAPYGLTVPDDAPEWAAEELARDEPWVVVRRAVPEPGMISVGARGRERRERYAFSAPLACVREQVTPEILAGERRWRMVRTARANLPALAILDEVAELLEGHGLAWGPVGSVGFELASGTAAATEGSDLDLILRCTELLQRHLAREIFEDLTMLPVRADAQIDTGSGSIALAEWAAGGQVMLRRAGGPTLTRNPWPESPGRELARGFAGEHRQ